MRDEKTAPDKVLSYRKADAIPSQMDTRKLEEPEPADGWINYNTYMANNVNVSGDLKMKHNTGQVQVSFDVNENGEPVNIKIERSLCQKCDEEAVRLIREGPKWKKKSKKPVEILGRRRDELWFASALIQKAYVGFYFMPVYADTTVKDLIKPELLDCLKGKSCFHIKKYDKRIFSQIKDALNMGYSLW